MKSTLERLFGIFDTFKAEAIFNKKRKHESSYKCEPSRNNSYRLLHGPSMFALKAKLYEVLYNRSSSIAFDETSSYWPAPKNS